MRNKRAGQYVYNNSIRAFPPSPSPDKGSELQNCSSFTGITSQLPCPLLLIATAWCREVKTNLLKKLLATTAESEHQCNEISMQNDTLSELQYSVLVPISKRSQAVATCKTDYSNLVSSNKNVAKCGNICTAEILFFSPGFGERVNSWLRPWAAHLDAA